MDNYHTNSSKFLLNRLAAGSNNHGHVPETPCLLVTSECSLQMRKSMQRVLCLVLTIWIALANALRISSHMVETLGAFLGEKSTRQVLSHSLLPQSQAASDFIDQVEHEDLSTEKDAGNRELPLSSCHFLATVVRDAGSCLAAMHGSRKKFRAVYSCT